MKDKIVKLLPWFLFSFFVWGFWFVFNNETGKIHYSVLYLWGEKLIWFKNIPRVIDFFIPIIYFFVFLIPFKQSHLRGFSVGIALVVASAMGLFFLRIPINYILSTEPPNMFAFTTLLGIPISFIFAKIKSKNPTEFFSTFFKFSFGFILGLGLISSLIYGIFYLIPFLGMIILTFIIKEIQLLFSFLFRRKFEVY